MVTGEGDEVWRSDDLPVRDTPLEIDWKVHAGRDADPVEFAAASADEALRPGGSDDVAVRARPNTGRGRRVVVGGLVALAAAAVVLVATRPDDSGQAEGDETASGGSLVEDSVPDSVPEPTTPVTSIEEGVVTLAESVDGIDRLELPPTLATMLMPTELVMVADEGRILTLSLPSGRVRAVEAASGEVGGFTSQIAVAPDAAVIGTGNTGIVVIPRAGPAIAVDAHPPGDTSNGHYVEGWERGANGESVFTVVTYVGNDAVRSTVTADGSVTHGDTVMPERFGYRVRSNDGSRIVNDAGGAYVIERDGTSRRIDDGFVYAASDTRRLVRHCDETFTCTVDLVDTTTGAQSSLDPATLPEDLDQIAYGATLSPDGTAIALQRNGASSERVLVAFDGGVTTTSPIAGWSEGASWAADSSGVFDVAVGGSGLHFTPADGGEPIVFGDELGRIVSIGARWPASELDPDRPVLTTHFRSELPLPDTDLAFAVAGRLGAMSFVDLDGLVAKTWEAGHRIGRGTPTLIVDGPSVVVLPADETPAYTTDPDRDVELSEIFAVDGPKLPGPTAGTVWVPTGDGRDDDRLQYRLLPLGAVSLEESTADVDLDETDLLGGDGRGGLVIARGGDVFVADGTDVERLTSGELLAIGAGTAVVRECDAMVACATVRVDRDTGARTTIDEAIGGDPGFDAIDVGRWAAIGTSMSPTGDVMVVRRPIEVGENVTAEDIWVFIDLVTGAVTAVDDLDERQPVVWSRDGRAAVVVADGSLHVYDRSSAAMVATDAPPVAAIAPS